MKKCLARGACLCQGIGTIQQTTWAAGFSKSIRLVDFYPQTAVLLNASHWDWGGARQHPAQLTVVVFLFVGHLPHKV